ncbi:MAG: hypothetical protein JWM80_5087 [Cyanobacteria bacterium RYN_339]|nr:hypothetical protein [Cyanobacteria bacterium RYN_339]
MFHSFTLAVALVLALATAPVTSAPDLLDKTDDTPDLVQTLPEVGLPGGGLAHCGPTAVSNSLVWLARHGHPDLAPQGVERPAVQGALVGLLASQRYMNTSLKAGTSPSKLMVGLEAYLQDHGVSGAVIGYQGARDIPPRFASGANSPDPRWLLRQFPGDAGAWMLIGWYRYDPETKIYKAFAGHWFSVVGYALDEAGRPDPFTPLVHDSAPPPRSQLYPTHDRMVLHPVPAGRRRIEEGPTASPTTPIYQIGGDAKLKPGADVGLLDGIVVTRLDGTWRAAR